VTVSAVTVSVVKTNVFSTLEGTWVRIYAYLHYMAGQGLNFGRPKMGRAWKIVRKKTGRTAIFRPVQESSTNETAVVRWVVEILCLKLSKVS